MKDWCRYKPWNPPSSPVREIKTHDIYDGTTTKWLQPNGGWPISEPEESVLSTPEILDQSMNDDVNISHVNPSSKESR